MKTKNMTVGKPGALIFTFALPLIAGNLFQEFYTVADTIIVGQFLGVDALAAVGSGGWITWMLLSAVQGLVQGFSIPAAQGFGAGDKAAIRKNMGNAAVLSLMLSIILMIIGETTLPALLRLLDTKAEIFDDALLYLRIYYAGCPIMVVFNYAACYLRAFGNSAAPLRAMIIAAVTNIVLDILFVGPLGFGIAGAVIATLIAQVIASVYALIYLFKIDFVTFSKDDLRIDFSYYKKILLIGAPMSLQNIIISIGGFIVQYIVNQYSLTYVAGFTATNRLYGLIETAGISYGYALTTYVGQNKGAGEYKRIKKGVFSGLLIGVATSIVIAIVMILFGKLILGMFVSGTPEEITETIQAAYRYLFIMSLFLPILYGLHIYKASLVGLGNSAIPMFSGVAELIMRVGASFIIPYYWGEMNLFFAEPVAWLGAFVVLFAGYLWCMNKLEHKMNILT